MVGGGEDGEWICIFRSGAMMGFPQGSYDDSRCMCYRCLEDFDYGQIGCSCGGVAAEDACANVYERYIPVDEMRSCLVLGVDIKPVMADKYIRQNQEYIKSRGGGGKKYEHIWCPDGGSCNSSDVPSMTFPKWVVWYERAGFRSTSSYGNMMNGVRDLGVRVDRLWRAG